MSSSGGVRSSVKRRRGDFEEPDTTSPKKYKYCTGKLALEALNFSPSVTKCEVGSTVTLEVLIRSNSEQDLNLDFEWMNDWETLTEEPPYSQVRQSQLKIHPVNFEMNSCSFRCTVTNWCRDGTSHTTFTDEFILSVESKLDQLKPVILSKHALFSKGKPVPSLLNGCVNLAKTSYALIQNTPKSWSNKTAFSCHSIRGSDDVSKEKSLIGYGDIFKGLVPGAKVAIMGRPGIGKTTLSYKLIYDWTHSNIIFENIRCVFLIDLHFFPKDKKISLAGILSLFLEEDKVDEYETLIHNLDGKGVCFIITGLEKYNPTKKKDTFIYKLLAGDILLKSVVIATCQPSTASRWNLQQDNVQQIEILGLSESNIYEYIQGYPFSSRAKANQLCRYMSRNPNILFLAYVPSVLKIICYVFNILGTKMPNTVTQIYESFVVSCVKNTTSGRRGQRLDFSMRSLMPKQKLLLGKLCRLAYQKLLPRHEHCTSEEVKRIIGNNEHIMGLFYLYDSNAYFLHTNVQQFLAAVHISKLRNEVQFKILEKSCNRNNSKELLWVFFCGLCPVTLSRKVDRIIQCTKNKHSFHCRCIFETQRPALCKQLVKASNILYFGHVMTSWDSFALAYIVRNAPAGSITLELYYTELSIESVKAFEKGSKKPILDFKLKGFKFQYYGCSMYSIELVVRLLKAFKSCQSLDFSKCLLNMPKLKAILSANVVKTAHSLNFTSCSLRAISFIILAGRLRACKNLEVLILHDNWMHVKGAKALASGFKSVENLKELVVHGEPDSLAELSKGFIHLKKIKYLCIKGNKLPEVAMKKLSHCKGLVRIDFSRCIYESSGALAFGSSLHSLTSLKVLNLTSCDISPQDMKHISDGMKHLSHLTTLLLEQVRVGGEGVQYISESFQFCSSLETLNFQLCGISGSDAKIFLQNLRHCTVLKRLNLSYNYFDDDSLQILSESLQVCSNSLQELLLEGNCYTSSKAMSFSELAAKHFQNLLKFTIDQYR